MTRGRSALNLLDDRPPPSSRTSFDFLLQLIVVPLVVFAASFFLDTETSFSVAVILMVCYNSYQRQTKVTFHYVVISRFKWRARSITVRRMKIVTFFSRLISIRTSVLYIHIFTISIRVPKVIEKKVFNNLLTIDRTIAPFETHRHRGESETLRLSLAYKCTIVVSVLSHTIKI